MKEYMNVLLNRLKNDIHSVDIYAPSVSVAYDPFDLSLSDV